MITPTSLTPEAPGLTSHRRRRVTGEFVPLPSAQFDVPAERDFYHDQFIEAPTLQQIGRELIDRWPEFSALHQVRIRYLWRKKGAVSAGKSVLGKSQKISGMAAYFGDCDFVITIAADFARGFAMTNHQMEAALYHELSHIQVGEDEKTGDPILSPVGHDAELFYREIERYGLWHDQLRGARDAFTQLGLDFTGEDE